MKIVRLITHGVLMVGFVAELGSLAIAETHTLVPTPKTVTWGYFDAKTPPVLRVNSGDTVDIEALIAAAPRQLEAAGVPREKIQQALIDIDREVTERGEIPHILTGPIYVDGAKPGDVLEVRILSVDLTIPYAVTFFMRLGGSRQHRIHPCDKCMPARNRPRPKTVRSSVPRKPSGSVNRWALWK